MDCRYGSASFIIIVLAAWFIIYSKSKKIQALVHTVGILSAAASSTPALPEEKELAPPSQLLKTVFMRLDSLYSTYFSASEPENRKKRLVNLMEKEIENLRSSKDFLLELEAEINAETGDLLKDVYKALPRTLLEKQRRLAAYLYFGLSNATICLLLQVEANALYKRKGRLFETLKESSSPRCSELLALLSSSR